MRVKTNNGLVFDLGLSGKETQEAFSDAKYRALAVGSPAGKVLQILVDEHWLEWLELVEYAPWLRSWTRSPLYAKANKRAQEVAGTDLPSGERIDEAAQFAQRKIAGAIYAEAVWGYGVADWLRGKHVSMGTDGKTKANSALRTVYNLQNLTKPSPDRHYTWDDKIYRGCGMLVPCEFGELDRWLEPLWVEAQEYVKTHLTIVFETV